MSDMQRIIWLASYPKSGNTWMRSLLAHYFMPKGQAPNINQLPNFTTGDVRKDFFKRANGGKPFVTDSIEEWMQMRIKALRLIALSKPNHHFVKTHCQTIQICGLDVIPPEVTAAAIYMMRNPFDLAPSFARHQNCDIDTAIDRMTNVEMMTKFDQGIYEFLGSWDNHVNVWTNAPGLPLHTVRYEDMLTKPGPTMRALLQKFLKVPVDTPKLTYAIKSTSFDAMRKQEEKLGFAERPPEMKRFFAKGQAGTWREDLTPAQVARIREAFLPTLEKWYPEMLKETGEVAASA